ncbi:hypothetical protein ACFOW1_08835 [Parasediminibacterium paludis]|uniref:Uncharacterized protein n=1 Tax=Parasediminibacterium paludis TaxID=908966 RepID=A0ABV8PWS0_9BACT
MTNYNSLIPKKAPSTRRHFVVGVGILSAIGAITAIFRLPFVSKKNIIACAPESKKKTVTMLTQDGRLVEIDATAITSSKKKVSNNELLNWIKKRQTTKS